LICDYQRESAADLFLRVSVVNIPIARWTDGPISRFSRFSTC